MNLDVVEGMNFSGNNSYYNQQDLCRGLDEAKIKPPKGFYPRLDANQPRKLEYSQGFLDPYAPVEYDYLIYPDSMLEPPKQPLFTDLPKNPSISEIQEDCSDGWNMKFWLHQLPFDQGFFDPWAQLPPLSNFAEDHAMEIIPSSEIRDCSKTVQHDNSCTFEPSKQPSFTVEEDYNDGCTYEELLEILNTEDTIINNTSPNIEESVSCSSSSDHQPKKEIKQKRRRRPSVRFVDLITKKKLSLGDKVHYRKKNKTELGAGIVRLMGIECCCCGIVYSMSKFEEHVVLKVNGRASHRAPTHIYLENGSSLENLQSEILQDHSH
ncbi:hypothetical protein ACLOJK_003416 [Asimina triloba]